MSNKAIPLAYKVLPLLEKQWAIAPYKVRDIALKYADYYEEQRMPFTAYLYRAALSQLEAGLSVKRIL